MITDAYSKLVAGDVTPIEAAAKRSKSRRHSAS